MKTKGSRRNSVEKTLDILSAFIPYNQEIGTLALSEKLGLNKATASRLLLTLTRENFLRQDSETKKFSLGQAALGLGRAVVRSLNTNIVQTAKPHIDRLRSTLNEACALEIVAGNNILLAYVAYGPYTGIRVTPSVGAALPIHASAGSKSILAYLKPKPLRNFLKGKGVFAPLTPNTITDPDVFMHQLQEIRQKGFSFDREEVAIGISGIGVPIFNHENEPVAALAVVTPSHRMRTKDDSNIIPEMKKTANKISAALLRIKDNDLVNQDTRPSMNDTLGNPAFPD